MSSGFTGNNNLKDGVRELVDKKDLRGGDEIKLKPKVVRIGKSTEKSVN